MRFLSEKLLRVVLEISQNDTKRTSFQETISFSNYQRVAGSRADHVIVFLRMKDTGIFSFLTFRGVDCFG